jgi:hypothetical protein
MRREVHIKTEVRYWQIFLHNLRLNQIILNIKDNGAPYEVLEDVGVMKITPSSQRL